jgi:8-oxo-dGTP diphosphatase
LARTVEVQAADDAAAAQWFPVTKLPPLAFDHKLVVRECLSRACDIPEASGMQAALRKGITLLAGDWKTQEKTPG